MKKKGKSHAFLPRGERAPYRQWGSGFEPGSIEQMENACSLPVAVAGALMPDAHQGYGLPIGGVLATRGAVIPYAVGVDIACRMRLSVLDWPIRALDDKMQELKKAIEQETRFGIGATFRDRRQHAVMERDWSFAKVVEELKDKAWSQLGTSGSGNHFVEFGTLTLAHEEIGLQRGVYLALLSHSGSRGTGAAIARYYSELARQTLTGHPKHLQHLAWLELDSEAGQEYWMAMELMGLYAAANHELIHQHLAAHLGADVIASVENHHNFAWKETHFGRELIVHRKGSTPAAKGALGVIPGSMASPAYLVRGLGQPESLNSAAHGAGRQMSRKAAKRAFNWHDLNELLRARGVTLISAGLDESPAAYKDIDKVMAEQRDLVEPLARFDPKLVKMAKAGEQPED
jgi:tRNA-splicing ligase RtcB (3'-phosphate/5'-hydroxy nucleic acid ligase)